MLVIVKGADGKQYIKYELKKENDRYPTVREIKEFVKNIVERRFG